jgi:farnesyl-diphosphate farnesyltransferase
VSDSSAGDPLASDRAWTFDAVQSVSRTFALSIDLLADPMSSWICTGYLLCRIADTVEDEPSIPPRRRAEILDTYDAVLDPEDDTTVEEFQAAVAPVRPVDGGDDWDVVDQTERALRVFENFEPRVQAAMRAVVREMCQGMARFLRRHADHGGLRLSTVDELEEYCWYVAGTVGQLFTNLREVRSPADATPDPEDARMFALFLQLINIAKDVRADRREENNVYLPQEWLDEEGVDHDAVDDPSATGAVARVVDRVVGHAEAQAPGARRYLRTIPEGEGGILEAAALPYLLALGTARELRGRTVEAVEQSAAVAMDRAEVEALFAEMQRGVTQEGIDSLAEAVRGGPYHRSERALER